MKFEIGKQVDGGKSIRVDIDTLIRTRMLVQANSGGGKSYALRRLLEQSHGKVQQLVIDLEGEFSTLAEKYDYLLVGRGTGIPADVRSAALLAEKLLELNASAILDLYELKQHERIRFVKLFLDAMMNCRKELWHPCIVVIDEAHVFAPEKSESESLQSVIDICTRGRKRSFCAILATQRLSKLHKDAAAECNNKLIGRTGLDVDRKRASEELGFTSKEDTLSLRTLTPGEFYIFGPAASLEVTKIKVGTVETTHPEVGKRVSLAPPPPSEKIKGLLSKLTDLPKEAEEKARTLSDAQKRIRELEQQLKRPAPRIDESIVTRAVEQARREGAVAAKAMETAIRQYQTVMKKAAEMLAAAVVKLPEFKTLPSPTMQKPKPEPRVEQRREHHHHESTLTNPEQRIIDAIAWLESIGVMEPEQPAVAFLAGYRYGGGAYNNPRGALRTKGLVEYAGQRIKLTEAGRSLANQPDDVLTDDELHDKVLARLPSPEQRVLKPLLEVYPEMLTNEELAERSGYKVGTGAYNNRRGRLRTLGLVEYQSGGVRAKDLLFPSCNERKI